jgi:hypothetical protein
MFRKVNGWTTWLVLFDLRKAYDSVDHELLLIKLEILLRENPRELLMFKWILSCSKIKVRENNKIININRGCP